MLRDTSLMLRNLLLTGICCLSLLVVPQVQPQDDPLPRAYSLAYGFDGVNGQNIDWQPYVHSFADGVEMVLVPPGHFLMGTNADGIDAIHQRCFQVDESCNRDAYELEWPPHEQIFTEPFWIDRYEVSREQYEACVEAGICAAIPPNEHSNAPQQPLNNINWRQARTYCEDWRDARLPTEAEWEYAARGPSGWGYTWGDSFDGTQTNFCDRNCQQAWRASVDDRFAVTAPVGSYPQAASWVGAFDMIGNLWEWTSSRLRTYPYEADEDTESPAGSSVRVIRGGSYNVNETMARAAGRFWLDPSVAGRGVGVRCARSM